MWVYHRPSGTRTPQKPPLNDSRLSSPSGDSASDALALRRLSLSSGEIGWYIVYRLRDAIRPWQNPKFGYSHGHIASLRLPSGGGCAQTMPQLGGSLRSPFCCALIMRRYTYVAAHVRLWRGSPALPPSPPRHPWGLSLLAPSRPSGSLRH